VTSRSAAARCRRKFLRFYPGGFRDADYLELERGYKWRAHRSWADALDESTFRRLLSRGEHREIARRAVRIEARTNLLFSFEKMALRDALESRAGAHTFAEGLFRFLHGKASERTRFGIWVPSRRGTCS
jgi:hypothetical protein